MDTPMWLVHLASDSQTSNELQETFLTQKLTQKNAYYLGQINTVHFTINYICNYNCYLQLKNAWNHLYALEVEMTEDQSFLKETFTIENKRSNSSVITNTIL